MSFPYGRQDFRLATVCRSGRGLERNRLRKRKGTMLQSKSRLKMYPLRGKNLRANFCRGIAARRMSFAFKLQSQA